MGAHLLESSLVSMAGPDESQQISSEEGSKQCRNHVVVLHRSEVLCRAGQVHLVGHHEEGAPERGEVVAEAVRHVGFCLLTHLEAGRGAM